MNRRQNRSYWRMVGAPTVGLALGAGRAVARVVGSSAVWTTELTDAAVLTGDVKEVTRALGELREDVAPRPAAGRRPATPRLYVALLPPLSDVRTLELPRMSREDTRRAVATNARRYFPLAAVDDVIGAVPTTDATDGIGSRRALVCAAAATAIRSIEESAAAAGWKLERVVPAATAWAAASPDGWLRASLPDRIETLRSLSGRPLELRRFPATTPAEQVVAAIGAAPSEIEPWLVAATGAASAPEPEFASEAVRADRTSRARRRTLLLAAAATFSLMGAGAVHAWGLAHELAVLRDERAKLRPRVEEVLAARDALDVTEARALAFERATGDATRWSEVIAALARELPPNAHVSSLIAVRDSMTLDIVSGSATAAFAAVRAVPGVQTVRALGPIRSEPQPGGGTSEQLHLAARFGPRSGATP